MITMQGNNYGVDGESVDEQECDECGDTYLEEADLKADSGECPSCSGGVLG